MRIRLLCCILVLLMGRSMAQVAPKFVSVRFVINERQVSQPVRLWFDVKGRAVEPLWTDNGFILAEPVWEEATAVGVRVKLGKRMLEFPEVQTAAIENGEWVIGVDTPPFEDENLPSPKDGERPSWVKEVLWIYYLSFAPTGKEGLRIVRYVNRGRGAP